MKKDCVVLHMELRIYYNMSFFTDEWKKRRDYRNRDLTSLWKLIFRIVLLGILIFLIKFFATGGVTKFWNYLLNQNDKPQTVIIEDVGSE